MKHEFWERTIKEFSLDRDLADFKTWDVVRQIPIYSEHELADDYYGEVRQLLGSSPHQSEWEQVVSKGEPHQSMGGSWYMVGMSPTS